MAHYVTYVHTKQNELDPNKILAQLYGGKTYAALDHVAYSKNYLPVRTMELPGATELPQDWTYMITEVARLATRCAMFSQEFPDTSTKYDKFYIPKHSGGIREINAPMKDLADLQREIVSVFTHILKIKAHNNAFAYVPGRSTKDALIRHKNNKSKWFLKMDVKGFFPNCDKVFILKQFNQVYPLYLIEDSVLSRIIDVCLLDGGLPQGAPSSPLITNIIMLPIDYILNHKLFNFNKSHYCVTRYADDILISNEYHFNYRDIVKVVEDTFKKQEAKFVLNDKKTRYASSAGRNWNLGLMYNNQGNITVGHKRKKRIKNAMYAIIKDNCETITWSITDAQIVVGELAYLQQIEPDALKEHISKLEKKYNVTWITLRKALMNQ